ncbi:MAG: zinc ribbon domain-containing protein [Verrucomicrobia bacterium]|nr:zinc ribbon domain-containing protein [Verrucomicrobiota bacterium]MCH8526489.1 zinc ribbon domain-containing protein [Kiritimatiellia bacterium]
MPTYDYVCTECDHALEAFHAMSAPPLKDCPACGKPALKRKIGTGAGLLFKGSGFYITDYRSDSYQKAAKSDKSDKGGEKAAPAKSESKPSPAASAPVSKPAPAST